MTRSFARMWLLAWSVAMVSSTLGPSLRGESADRDKSGTTRGIRNTTGSQVAFIKPLASRASFQAEGTGVEPATPYGAPVLQTGR